MSGPPTWVRARAPSPHEAEGMRAVRGVLERHRLTTVCQGALCPNAAECWGRRTATFLLLGDVCTRACRFCGVRTGNPGGVVDVDEPERLSAAVEELGLSYVVLTSVDRDDLEDGGALLFAASVRAVRARVPDARIEVLVPDFSGREASLEAIASCGADVLGHNLETVRRTTPIWRDRRAGYDLSLSVLARLHALAPQAVLKGSLILGLGEERGEVLEALRDLRQAGVEIVAIGQYLRPDRTSLPVVRYLEPAEFEELAQEARGMGFRSVLAGPLVRSSYHAERLVP